MKSILIDLIFSQIVNDIVYKDIDFKLVSPVSTDLECCRADIEYPDLDIYYYLICDYSIDRFSLTFNIVEPFTTERASLVFYLGGYNSYSQALDKAKEHFRTLYEKYIKEAN